LPAGPPPQYCLKGKCQPYCVRDDHCTAGKCCDFVSGSCQVFRLPEEARPQCVDGDRRRRADKLELPNYGVDTYVSYGYTGGLDLKGITVVRPKG
jgi:hypothetical protein